MALQDLIQLIKTKANITEVIKATGVGEFSNPSDSLYRGRHGTHEDSKRNDSCRVHGREGWWKCFVCGAGGDVVSWVLHAKFKGEKSRYRDAVQWLADYYNFSLNDTPLNIPQRQMYDLLTDLSWRWHEALMERHPEELEWVKQKWGLDTATIEKLRLGYCEGVASLSEYDSTALMNAGVVDSRATQPLDNRIIFPYFRDSLVVWMAGRTPYDREGVPKYSSLNRTSYVMPTLYNFDNAYTADPDSAIVFTEGLGDAARAYQDSIRVVASGGAQSFTHEMYTDTTRLLNVCKDIKYIIYDSDASGAGINGAKSLAQALITFGTDPIIIELPRLEDRKQVDLCDFLNEEGLDALWPLLKEAERPPEGSKKRPRTLPNILIDELPEHADPDRISRVLESIAPLSPLISGKYMEILAAVTKISKDALRKEADKIRKKQERTDRKVADDYHDVPFLAQDYVYHADSDVWRAHTCLFVPYAETIRVGSYEETINVVRPVHLCVDMGKDGVYTIAKDEVFIDPSSSIQERLPSEVIVNAETNRWSVSSRFPYSFNNFVAGKAQSVDVGDLYQRLYSMFDRYIWLPDERDKHILSLYVMLTYIFMGFPAIPYLHFRGKKDSGKSTGMEIVGIHAFNSTATSTLSEAVMFRIAHATRPTFIIDEAEKLRNPPAGSMDFALLQLALGSYANNDQAQALRCNKNDLEPEAFRTYSPKIFGSINELKDTLRSRSIVIDCACAPPSEILKLSDWDADKVYLHQESQELRDRLRVWALTQFRLVREAYDGIKRDRASFLMTRDRQIWKPLLAIADVVSQAWGTDVSAIVLADAMDKVKKNKVTEASTEFGNLVLAALYDLWLTNKVAAGYYRSDKKDCDFISLAIAVGAIKLKLQADAVWIDNFNRLDAVFLGQQLRQVSAIPNTARSTTATVSGSRRDVLPFAFDKLKEYVQTKGLKSEEIENED